MSLPPRPPNKGENHHQTQADKADSSSSDIEYDDVPLHRQRPFGSGISMRPVKFVPASSSASGDRDTPAARLSATATREAAGSSAMDAYLAIVFASASRTAPSSPPPLPSNHAASESAGTTTTPCEVCGLPLANSSGTTQHNHSPHPSPAHEASLAHQVSLPHSHPPSSLDRSRMGLLHLQSQGWDPDSRLGLGPERSGIAFPLKVVAKEDTSGLGLSTERDEDDEGQEGDGVKSKKREKEKEFKKLKLLDAGKVRKMEAEGRKRTERLRQQFYGSTDLEKYLGPGA